MLCLPKGILVFALLFPIPIGFGAAETPQVLVIHGANSNTPWQQAFNEGLFKGFNSWSNTEIYFEYLDNAHFSKQHWPIMADYLDKKYHTKDLGLIVTLGLPGAAFLQGLPQLLSGVPRLYMNPLQPLSQLSPQDSQIQIHFDFEKTLKDINRIWDFKKLYLIANSSSEHEKKRLEMIRNSLQNSQIPYQLWLDRPIEQLKTELAKLDPQDAVFYLPLFNRSEINSTPKKILTELVAISSAPIFSAWDSLLGSGIVGGWMLAGEQLGPLTADYGKQIITRGTTFNIEIAPYEHLYDARALERWGIDLSRLPQDAHVLFTEDSFFQQHFWKISSFFFAFMALLIFTAFLIISVRRRNHYLIDLWHEREALENRVTERTLQLQIAKARAEALARTDPLTGLNNRRAFYEIAGDIRKQVHRYHHPTTTVIVDLDHFKRINDTYGHSNGDQVLIKTAQTIKNTLRETDLAGRLGGEEFALIISDTAMEQAKEVAERLRHAIEAIEVVDDGKLISITASIGLAELLSTDESIEDSLKRADIALYTAKSQGRNRCCSYPASLDQNRSG